MDESDVGATISYCIASAGGVHIADGSNIDTITAFLHSDPMFISTAMGTEDLSLAAMSPAINAGNNDSLPAGITVDIAGLDRINCDTIDMGAHESQVPLQISCSGSIIIDTDLNMCTTASANVNLVSPTANCNITVTNNAPASFPIGSTTFKWFVVDTDGRRDTCEQTVTVVDNQKPTITCAPDTTITDGSNVMLDSPTIGDNCIGDLTLDNNAPTIFDALMTTITWTVADIAGNENTCDQIVILDSIDPCEEDITIDQSQGGFQDFFTNQKIFLNLQVGDTDVLELYFGVSTEANPGFEIAKGGQLEIYNTGCP